MTLFETLLTTSSSGGFALLGGWLTFRYNRKNIEDQHSLDKWKFNRNILLSKAEELASLISEEKKTLWERFEKYSYHSLKIEDDEPSYVALLNSLKMPGKYKVEAIVSIYFPELNEAFLLVVKAAHEGVSADFKFKLGAEFKEVALLDVSIAARKTIDLLNDFNSKLSELIKNKFR